LQYDPTIAPNENILAGRSHPSSGINAKDNLYPQDLPLGKAKHFCKSYFDTSLEVSIKGWISR
jgi:hypothetical protein